MLIVGLIVSAAIICYSEFILKKQNGMTVNNQNIQPNYNGGYQQYGYNSQQPIQNNYNQQPVMQNGYNNDFNTNNNFAAPQTTMPMNNGNPDIFNQAPVTQATAPMENSFQQVDMMNQSVINNFPQQTPVQDFSNPVPSTIMCPQCRATLNAGASFCNQCGSKLN
jgi:hypothetical protein